MKPLNKDRIRQRFFRAAATYDSQAVIQLQVAQRVLKMLAEHLAVPPQRILEIGCCTGLLTARLHRMFEEAATFYVNDLVPEFQTRVAERLDHDPRLVFLPGDIEKLDIPRNLDLIVSSSTLHWLEDLPSFFRRLSNFLTAKGTFCFSLYGAGNLAQVREITGLGLDYYSRGQLQTLVAESFDVLGCDEEEITLQFNDPMSLLAHLRQTGVNALDASPWTRSRLLRFQQEYIDRFSRQGKVILTYHPIYCIARSKS
ncbi:MAG: malonyl-ACP O-methyltransferase BioC [Desulfobulbaceae bacterium]|nr:malonyl-ACP O-methyltransferase BioC [Desulfobulbaceae bacterium]